MKHHETHGGALMCLTRTILTLGTAFAMQVAPGLCADAAEPQVIVDNGKPSSLIVVDPLGTKSARFAARELQWHIRMISGAEIPIVSEPRKNQDGVIIYVGDSQYLKAATGLSAEGLRTQECVLSVKPKLIVLTGKDSNDHGDFVYDIDNPAEMAGIPDLSSSNGTLYAVYEFLERFCGVRWFTHTEAGTVMPEMKTLAIPCGDLRLRPAFTFRGACGAAYHDGEFEYYDGESSLWRGGWHPEELGFKEYDAVAYENLHAKYRDASQYRIAKRNFINLYLLRNRDGGDPSYINHSLYKYYDRFWDAKENRKPGLFAKGYETESKPPQLCYSSPELVKQVVQDAVDYYDGNKRGLDLTQNKRWPVLPNPFPLEIMDNTNYCKCESCRAMFDENGKRDFISTGQHSDYWFKFVNEVSRQLRDTYPDKNVAALAYATHANVPSFKLDPSVNVQFCFYASRMPFSSDYEHELKYLAEWVEEKKASGRELGIWLYYCHPVECGHSQGFHCFPGFFAHTIGKQMRLFKEYGIYGMFFDHFGQEVDAYVTFRLMNDPSLDVDMLLGEYFNLMYGKASKPMHEMYSMIEETYTSPTSYNGKGNWFQSAAMARMLGTEERMKELGNLMEAAKAAPKTTLEAKRVAIFEKAVWSYMKDAYKENPNPRPSVNASEVPKANGDLNSVDWAKAAPLGGTWFKRASDVASTKKLSGKICHDDGFLYLELTDECDPGKLTASPTIAPYDDWEIFISNQRNYKYRQYLVGPNGELKALAYGETTDQCLSNGVKAVSDIKSKGKWIVRMSFPLETSLPRKAKKGDAVYMNVIRCSPEEDKSANISSWVSYSKIQDSDRLGKIVLE